MRIEMFYVLQIRESEYWAGRFSFRSSTGVSQRISVENITTGDINRATPISKIEWELKSEMYSMLLDKYPEAKLI